MVLKKIQTKGIIMKNYEFFIQKFFYNFFVQLIRFIEKFRNMILPGNYLLAIDAIGHLKTLALKTASELRIIDYIYDRPLTLSGLAEKTKSDIEALERILKILNAMNIVKLKNKKYHAGKCAKYITAKSNQSLINHVYMIANIYYPGMQNLTDSIKTGKTTLEQKYGNNMWEYFAKNPKIQSKFNKAMFELSAPAIPAFIEAYDFSKFNHVIDIGGGLGQLLYSILEKYENVNCTLYESTETIEKAKMLNKYDKRMQFVTGDFIDFIPAGADCYIMKWIIHDWNDKKAITILKNCDNAMKPGEKLILIELVQKETSENNWMTLYLDMLLLCMYGGKERTIKEFKELLKKTNLKLINIYNTASYFKILECKKEETICQNMSIAFWIRIMKMN